MESLPGIVPIYCDLADFASIFSAVEEEIRMGEAGTSQLKKALETVEKELEVEEKKRKQLDQTWEEKHAKLLSQLDDMKGNLQEKV